MPTVSACLIVRDEEESLELCLEALEPWVDEICVLDTGSRDRTVAIAEACGARVGRFEWRDDFAAARNACLDLASSDWVLSVDADELLDPESAPALREVIAEETAQAWLVWLDNLERPEECEGSEGASGKPRVQPVALARLFRRRAEIRWSRPVHESIMDSLIALGGGNLGQSGVRLVHSGYLPEVVRARRKRERNLSILERWRAEHPDDLYNLYKLAGTLSMLDRVDDAREVLEGAWTLARPLSSARRAGLPFLPLVASELLRMSLESGRPGLALEVAAEALEEYPTVSEILFQAGEVSRATGRFEEARRRYALASAAEPWTDLYRGDPATRGHKPLIGLAKLAAIAGDLRLAADTNAKALELAPDDLELLALGARLMALGGRLLDSWRALGGLLERAPGNPHVALLAAEMAWARDEAETAIGFWRGALTTRRASHSARAWLAVAELTRGDFSGLEEHLAALRPVDLPEAAGLALLHAIGEREYALDPAFEPAAVLGELASWLSELSRDPEQRALERYARGAARLERGLPGAGALLRRDGPRN